MKERALLIIVALISHALTGHHSPVIENECDDSEQVLEQFKTKANKVGVSIDEAMKVTSCTSAYDSGSKRSIKSLTFQHNDTSCTISYAHKSHSTVLHDEADDLIEFKRQIEVCNSQLRTANSVVAQTKKLEEVMSNEKESSNWALLLRAFTKFTIKGLIHSDVLYKQNVVRYTHTEDDGDHLRVLLAMNKTVCELQIYKHPAHEGDHARVCHDEGPKKEEHSHYIRSREDRRFVLPNCAILFATEEGKRHIAAFMRE